MVYRSHNDYTVYQVNLKGFQPYYTHDKQDAAEVFQRLRTITSKCSLRRMTYYRMLKKIYH